MKVGIFDSGVGGLTVLKELISHKKNDYIYIGDTLNMPYGGKTKEELRRYVHNIMSYFIKEKVDIVIIACGTISSNLYEELKKKYDIEIYDIISPTINYIKEKDINNVGVIATVNTINSTIFEKKLGKRCIQTLALPKLASLIEEENPETEEYLKRELSKLNKEIKLLILGCTHYPIVNNIIEKKFNTLNMAKPLINYINESENLSIKIMFTKLTDEVKDNTFRILEKEYQIEELKL